MTQAPRSQGRKRSYSQVKMVTKKRRVGKKGATRSIIRQPGLIVADKLLTTLTYASVVKYSPGVSGEDRQFNLNSTFDPDRTGVGHQPLGRDQLVTFYNRYRVLKCSWEVDMCAGSSTGAYMLCVWPSNEVTSVTNFETAIETAYSQYRVTRNQLSGVGTDGRHAKIKGSMNLGKLYGVSDQALKNDDRYAAEFGSSPTENASLHCLTSDVSEGNIIIYTLAVKLVYTVEWYDRIQLAAS